jgi:hypothetical protein
MSHRIALLACAVTLLIATSAAAHHPGGAGNSGAGGPIITIPAETLEQGHFAAAVWYEYIRFGGIGDPDLINAASKHIHAHSIRTVESAAVGFAYGVTRPALAMRASSVSGGSITTCLRQGRRRFCSASRLPLARLMFATS